MTFSQKRKELGLSVDDIHVKTRISLSTLYNWEREDKKPSRLGLAMLVKFIPEFKGIA